MRNITRLTGIVAIWLCVAAMPHAQQARPSPASGPVRAPSLTPCEWRGIAGRVECGTLTVPENRDRPNGRALSIFFVVVRATGAHGGEPIFFFTGGPGTAASDSAAGLSRSFAGLRAARDFVFIDQRGTGRSAPLACPSSQSPARSLRPMFDRAETAACRETLENQADLRLYTTSDAALDVDDVRQALGYSRVAVHGSSYGSRAAWEYAARFPSRTRAMVLHGPVPPGFLMPMPFARGLDAALEGLIAGCAKDADCASRFPSLGADVARAFDRLRAGPAPVRVGDVGGPLVDTTLTFGELAEAVRYRLYTPTGAAGLPSMLARAATGDYAPIANAAIASRARLERGIWHGMYLSVSCAEDIPLMTPEAVRASSSGTRLGDYRVRQQMAACREWPRGAAPGAHFGPPLQVPALLQVGEFDPATPIDWARRALDLLPNGRLVVIPHGAHGFSGLGIDGCLAAMTTGFVERGTARGLDTSCVAAAKRPPFTLR